MKETVSWRNALGREEGVNELEAKEIRMKGRRMVSLFYWDERCVSIIYWTKSYVKVCPVRNDNLKIDSIDPTMVDKVDLVCKG